MSAGHSPNVRLAVFKRDDWTCRECGFRQTEDERRKIAERGGLGRYLTIDHIVPKSKGGRNAAENLQVLCNHCNRAKADSCDPADVTPERIRKRRPTGFGGSETTRSPAFKSWRPNVPDRDIGNPPLTEQAQDGARGSPKRSWWFVDVLRPFEFALHLPWFNRRRPYVALHVAQWGYEVYQGRSRRILHVGLMWGRLFTDRKTYPAKWWDMHGRWTS